MEALLSLLSSSLDQFAYHYTNLNQDTVINMMTSCLWIICITLFLVVVQAEAWMPPAIYRFKQRIQKRRLRNNATKTSHNEDGVATMEKEDEEEDTETAERRRLSVLPWWEDSWSEAFMNSFPITSVVGTPTSEEIEVDELAHYEKPQVNASAQVLHFCFLSHGHRGFATDLSYLQRVMQHHAELEKRQRQNDTTVLQHDMVVHCAQCNEGKTTDGVENGGERLVQEILQVIRAELKKRERQSSSDIQDITISIVGNSLGGIYGRYAIARLAQQAADEENHPELTNATDDNMGCVLLDGKYRLHFNIFCSTASPHLGISKHTYVPLPRSVELGAARVLGDTGRDLFRLNDLLKTMATCPTFLDPLRRFRKRVAYANAYKTDFPVPASTAAFLSEQSTYPHHFAEEDNNGDDNLDNDDEDDSRRHIVATLHTPMAQKPPAFSDEAEDIVDDLVQMSASLDSLGWKKVFIDVRQEIPLRVALPRSRSIRRTLKKNLIVNPLRLRKSLSEIVLSGTSSSTNDSTSGYDSDDSSSTSSSQPRPSAIHRLRQKGVVESRDVASVVSTPDDMRLSFPLGHNLMVALSRDGISGGLYKGGRPVMDSLAKELVHDIFDWNFEAESDAAAQEARKLSQGGH